MQRLWKHGRAELRMPPYDVRGSRPIRRFHELKLINRRCRCGHQFCYLCGGAWRAGGCGCERFDRGLLQQRAAEIGNRPRRYHLEVPFGIPEEDLAPAEQNRRLLEYQRNAPNYVLQPLPIGAGGRRGPARAQRAADLMAIRVATTIIAQQSNTRQPSSTTFKGRKQPTVAPARTHSGLGTAVSQCVYVQLTSTTSPRISAIITNARMLVAGGDSMKV